jgi:hypothetical protein
MRFARGDVRDHIVSNKNDHQPSYWPQRTLPQQQRLKIDFARFSGSFDFRLLQQYRRKADICQNAGVRQYQERTQIIRDLTPRQSVRKATGSKSSMTIRKLKKGCGGPTST